MREAIFNFPKQFSKGINAVQNIPLQKNFKKAVICGMGGSSMPGYILEMAHPEAALQIHPNFDLPPEDLENETLVVCVSWSGNTEETISSYKTALKKNLAAVMITKGGKLGDIGKTNNSPIVLLPGDKIPPRIAVGYMYGALLEVLAEAGIIRDETEAVKNLEKTISPEKLEALEERAKQLAQNIGNKIPLIYAPFPWRNQAGFWKVFFNENAKVHAFWNSLPALTHNELAGFNKSDVKKFFTIFLNDKDADNRYKELAEKFDSVLEGLGYSHDTIDLDGSSMTEKIFLNYVLAAFSTMHLAKILGVEPRETELIEKFKKL